MNNKIAKLKNMSSVAKVSLVLVFSKFFQKGLAMITTPIFTRIMTQSEYGVLSTFLSWQSVLLIITTLNMSSGVFNNGMLEFKKDRDSFTFSILTLANTCTVICFIIYLIFSDYLQEFMQMSNVLILVMFSYFLFIPAYNYWISRQRYEYKYIALLIITIVSSLVSTGTSLLAVLISPVELQATYKIMSTEFVSILLGIIFYILLAKNSKLKVKFKYWKYALKINLPLVPHYLSLYVLSSSDRIMISNLVNSSATAIYNLSYTVASIILIVWNSVDAAYAPWIYQKLDEKKYKDIAKRGNQVLILFAFIAILASLFAPEAIQILGPDEYYEGIYVIPSVSVGVFFTALFSLFMRIELYLKKTKFSMVATVIAAGLNIVLNLIFIPLFGYYAAGYTTLVCYIILSLLHYLNLRKLKYDDIYNKKIVLIVSILLCLSMVVVTLIYPYTIIRYILILAIVVVAFIKRKIILSLIKKNKK